MSRPRVKRENQGLPRRWRYRHGAYFYQVPAGSEGLWDGKKEFRLGKSLPEAYAAWAKRLQSDSSGLRTIGELLDRYALEVVPRKAPKTQREQVGIVAKLRAVFGHMPLTAIEPHHVYRYVDQRSAKTAAIREVEVLRHALTKAVEWGRLRSNPLIKQLQLRGRKPKGRDRYVEDWEVIEALSLVSRRKYGSVRAIQAYIRIKLLTALRRSDLLHLRVSDLKEDGIYVQPRKTAHTTGKRIIVQWTSELRDAVASAKAARPLDVGPWLFCTRRGEPYVRDDGSTNGWDSMWQRFMARVLQETRVEERFTEHDLRAKCASDLESLEHARQLLAHADTRTTQRWYRRRPERVMPGQGIPNAKEDHGGGRQGEERKQ